MQRRPLNTLKLQTGWAEGRAHHVGVSIVDGRFLEPIVEDDEDGVYQVAGVADVRQKVPEAVRQ